MIISQKLRIAQHFFLQKMSARLFILYPANFANFEEILIFGCETPLLDARGAQTRYDVMWNITPSLFSAHFTSYMSRWSLLRRGAGIHIPNFTPIFSFSTLRIFYVKMATYLATHLSMQSQIKLCISLLGTGPLFISLYWFQQKSLSLCK